jgi:YD repeat-containing protein
MQVNNQLIRLATQLAQDGKIDREEADRIVSEAIADGRIDEADRAALLRIKDVHWTDLWIGGAARRFQTWADGGRDAALISALMQAETDGVVDPQELERIMTEADEDGLSLEEISTLRSALLGGTDLSPEALRQLERVRGVIPPHHRSDVGLRPPDPTPPYTTEILNETNSISHEVWDDQWTHKELDVDGDGDIDSIVDRTFGADGRLTAIAADTDGDGQVDHRQRLTYDNGRLSAVDVDVGTDPAQPDQRTEYRYCYGADGRLSTETATRIEDPNGADRRVLGREIARHSRDPNTGQDVVIFEGDRVRPDVPPSLRGVVPQGRVLEEQWVLDGDGTLQGRHVRTEIDDPEKMVWQEFQPPQEPEDDPSLTGSLLDEAAQLAGDGTLSHADVETLIERALPGGIDEDEKKQLEAIAARHRDKLEDPEDRWRLAISARSEPEALGLARELERNSGGRIDGEALGRLLDDVKADGKIDPAESSLLSTIYYGAVRTTDEAKKKLKTWVEIPGPITGPFEGYDIPATEHAYERVQSGALLDRANELAADGKISQADAATLIADAEARGFDPSARDELLTVVARYPNAFERYEDARRMVALANVQQPSLLAHANDVDALLEEVWSDGKVTPEERATLQAMVEGAAPMDDAARGELRRSTAMVDPWETSRLIRRPARGASVERGADGLVSSVDDGTSKQAFEYDDQHRLTKVITARGDQVTTATFTYDAQGRPLEERSERGTVRHTWRDDGTDVIDSEIGSSIFQRELDAAGREVRQADFGPGESEPFETRTTEYDAFDRVKHVHTERLGGDHPAIDDLIIRRHDGTGKRAETIEERSFGDMRFEEVNVYDPNHQDRVIERTTTSENGGSVLVENKLHVGVNAVRRGFVTDFEKKNTYRYDEVGRLIGGGEDVRETYRIDP